MQQHISYIQKLVEKGGPDYEDYPAFATWLQAVHVNYTGGRFSPSNLDTIRAAFKDALSPHTLQGHSYQKPFGYPGDFQVIDKIYQLHVSGIDHLKKWDIYYHQQKAAKAVRNRKTYFKDLLAEAERKSGGRPVRVLNLASGPARDVFEFLCCASAGQTFFDCVDMDEKAIEFAGELCSAFGDHVSFHQANVFRFRCARQYDLIWSAGLFDYLNDRQFFFMLQKYLPFVLPGGSLVIGNFSTNNPTRPYMEIVNDWRLCHRDEEKLISLALQAGIDHDNIHIGCEPEELNLFLHIEK